jgi:hypothetical protein
MTGADWTEAERMWRQADKAQDRLDMVERALAAVGRTPARGAGSEDLNQVSGRTK